MEKVYDKNRLVSNVEFLLRRSNIKVGDLETQCGVSVGYLSRLKNNESNDVSPSAEVLLRLSKLLNVSITSLLCSDYNSMTETEIFIQKFLEDMIKKTEANLLLWDKHAGYEIYHEVVGESGEDLPIVSRSYDTFGDEHIVYNSLFTDKYRYVDDYYYTLAVGDKTYYLVSVSADDVSFSEYELYILMPDGSFKTICCSNDDSNRVIIKLLNDLYSSVEKSSNLVRIDEDVKKSLDDFMLDKKD